MSTIGDSIVAEIELRTPALRREADEAIRRAMSAWYNLAMHTAPGPQRDAALKVYERLQGVAIVPGLPGNF